MGTEKPELKQCTLIWDAGILYLLECYAKSDLCFKLITLAFTWKVDKGRSGKRAETETG